MQDARLVAASLAAQGYGDPTEGYSWLDRARILADVAPYAPETGEAIQRAFQQAERGEYGPNAIEEVGRIKDMRRAVVRKFELYPTRFSSLQKLISPDVEYQLLSENQNIKAAAEYGPIARLLGAGYELLANRSTLIHRRFLNIYTPEQHYAANNLYGSENAFWDHPYRDFIEPGIRSLRAADDPVSGGMSWALTGATFGSSAFGILSGMAGTLWGAAHGAYRNTTDSTWIPKIVREQREYSEYFDRLQYVKAMRQYEQTKDPDWLKVASETLSGVNPYDQSRKGWTSFYRAMPEQDRPYIDAFMNTKDGEARERIREMVSPRVRDVLEAKWDLVDHAQGTREYTMSRSEEMTNYFRSHHLPKESWLGWHPMASLEDIQVKTLDRAGLDAHEFGLGWADQRRRMAHSPFLPGPIDIYDSTGETFYPENLVTPGEVRQALENTIRQMNLKGSVSVNVTSGTNTQSTVTVNITRARHQSFSRGLGAIV